MCLIPPSSISNSAPGMKPGDISLTRHNPRADKQLSDWCSTFDRQQLANCTCVIWNRIRHLKRNKKLFNSQELTLWCQQYFSQRDVIFSRIRSAIMQHKWAKVSLQNSSYIMYLLGVKTNTMTADQKRWDIWFKKKNEEGHSFQDSMTAQKGYQRRKALYRH